MNFWALVIVSMTAGCATSSRCLNPEGARVILANNLDCSVRIRQVVIGSDLKLPESVKSKTLSSYKLEWVEEEITGNKIVLGHFILVPTGAKPGK